MKGKNARKKLERGRMWKDEDLLECFTCEFVFNPVKEPGGIIFGPPVTGFMNIRYNQPMSPKAHICPKCYGRIMEAIQMHDTIEFPLARRPKKRNENNF